MTDTSTRAHDDLSAAVDEAAQIRTRSAELIAETESRIQQLREHATAEVTSAMTRAETQAAEIVEQAEARAAAIIAEAEERSEELLAVSQSRVDAIEEEAVKAGIEAVEQDRERYKANLTEIVEESLRDAKALIENGREQAQEIVDVAEERAQAANEHADTVREEADRMRAEAEEEVEGMREHAGEMLAAIEKLKKELEARAAAAGIDTTDVAQVNDSAAQTAPTTSTAAPEPAPAEEALSGPELAASVFVESTDKVPVVKSDDTRF